MVTNWTPQTVKAWTAGIIDGEGYVQLQKHTKTKHRRRDYLMLRLRVENTDRKMVDMLQLMWGGSVIFKERDKKRKDQWGWQVNCGQALRVLECILPYLVIRRERAELAIDFQNRVARRLGLSYEKGNRGVLLSEDEWQIRCGMYEQMKALNRKGRTVEKVIDTLKNGK